MCSMADQLMVGGHEVVFLVNRAFRSEMDELVEEIKARFSAPRICAFDVPVPCAPHDEKNGWRQAAARLLREACIAALEPDFVYLPALLADGWGDDAVGSVNELGLMIPTAITQHDLIPLAMEDLYLPPSRFRDYYMKKLDDARHVQLFMAISEFSRKEVISLLGVPERNVVCISSAVDPDFSPVPRTSELTVSLLARLGIRDGFILYAPGGFDPRKNVERLLEAYAGLAREVRQKHQLVLASQLDPGRREKIESYARHFGVADNELVLTDYISDAELKALYSACHAYVFPSLHEGFGLPVLEAMACGAPIIASDCTGIPEVVGLEAALFDPYRVGDIRERLDEVIHDEAFRRRLKAHAPTRVGKFSWERSASIAVEAILKRHGELVASGWSRVQRVALPTCDDTLEVIGHMETDIEPTAQDVTEFRRCFNENLSGVLR